MRSRKSCTKLFILLICFVFFQNKNNAQTAVVSDDGSYSSGHSSAVLDVYSESKGLLLPRIEAASQPSGSTNGLLYYQSDGTTGLYLRNAGAWEKLSTFTLPTLTSGSVLFSDGSSLVQDNSNFYWDDVNNRLGIGTTSPNEQLELTGNLRLPGTTSSTGIVYSDANTFMHTYGSGNQFFGINAGNLSLTGTNNIGIGEGALSSLTTGPSNTAIGYYAGNSLFNSVGSTLVGCSTSVNLTGIANTVYGHKSGFSATSADYNVIIGVNANYYNQTGDENTIIGSYAGSGSSLHNKTGSVFIGYKAGQYETNSNKLYIENSNSTSPLIYGDFSTDEIKINGSLELSNGTSVNEISTDGTFADNSDDAVPTEKAVKTYLTANTGIWSKNGDEVYYNTDYVGIGLSDPTRQLSVYENNTSTYSQLYIEQDGTGDANLAFGLSGSTHYMMGIDNSDANKFKIGYHATTDYYVSTGTVFTINTSGDVGIGTTSPGSKLHVEGTIEVDQKIQANDAGGLEFASDEGTTRMVIQDDGDVGIGNTSPSYELDVDGDIRGDVYRDMDNSSYYIDLSSSGYSGLFAGKVGIGTSTPSCKLQVVGDEVWIGNSGTADYVSGDGDLYVADDLEVDGDIRLAIDLYVGDDLTVTDAVTFPDVYNTNISGGRDVYINNLGVLGYNSSSKRYKENIENIHDIDWIYDLRPVSFNYKSDSLKTHQYGLIAEEVEMINEKLVFYNEKGEVESLHYDQLVPVLVQVAKTQKAEIESMKAEIETLKKIVGQLTLAD